PRSSHRIFGVLRAPRPLRFSSLGLQKLCALGELRGWSGDLWEFCAPRPPRLLFVWSSRNSAPSANSAVRQGTLGVLRVPRPLRLLLVGLPQTLRAQRTPRLVRGLWEFCALRGYVWPSRNSAPSANSAVWWSRDCGSSARSAPSAVTFRWPSRNFARLTKSTVGQGTLGVLRPRRTPRFGGHGTVFCAFRAL